MKLIPLLKYSIVILGMGAKALGCPESPAFEPDQIKSYVDDLGACQFSEDKNGYQQVQEKLAELNLLYDRVHAQAGEALEAHERKFGWIERLNIFQRNSQRDYNQTVDPWVKLRLELGLAIHRLEGQRRHIDMELRTVTSIQHFGWSGVFSSRVLVNSEEGNSWELWSSGILGSYVLLDIKKDPDSEVYRFTQRGKSLIYMTLTYSEDQNWWVISGPEINDHYLVKQRDTWWIQSLEPTKGIDALKRIVLGSDPETDIKLERNGENFDARGEVESFPASGTMRRTDSFPDELLLPTFFVLSQRAVGE